MAERSFYFKGTNGNGELHEYPRAAARGAWVCPTQDADDGAQQVFMTFARKLDVVEADRERSFLLGVALRVASGVRRAQKRRRLEPETALSDATDPRPGATVPGSSGITGHPGARTNSYVANNDVVSEANISGSKYERWYFINAIEVMAPAEAFTIVALGDSITDGYGIHDEFKRWPDFLTAAINADPDLKDLVSVIDAGNGGNALLNGDGYMDAGVDRVARDILARPKVKHVIVLFGVNDILYGTFPAGGAQGMADNIIAGYQEIVDACRAAGIKVYGSPITPFGANNADAQLNSARTIVNTAVLAGDIFDEVIDFSAVLVQPGSNPEAIQASMNNDGLHPSAAGYEAMANAVDLALFK